MHEVGSHGGSGRQRGFTLIELMTTVAIVGVLAILASVGYARWLRRSKTAEATAMIASIKGAQETYRAETLRYLPVSGISEADLNSNVYPAGTPGSSKVAWNTSACGGNVACTNFQRLGVKADGFVYYRYSSIAGAADGASRTINGFTYPAANDPWYIVRAYGDLNGDGRFAYFHSSSFESTVRTQNEDE